MKKAVQWTWYSFVGILAIGVIGGLFGGIPYWAHVRQPEIPHLQWAGLISMGGIIALIILVGVIVFVGIKIHGWAWDK